MSGNRRRTLELVYSNDRPVGVVEPGSGDLTTGGCGPVDEAQAIERLLTYLYEELQNREKRQPAHLVGAAILALRDEVDGNGGGASQG